MTNPSDIVFQSISNMTGGLINDLTTAIIAMAGIGIILMGFEYLKDCLVDSIHTRETNAALDRARSYKSMADEMDDEVSKDYLNARYRNEIRRAAK